MANLSQVTNLTNILEETKWKAISIVGLLLFSCTIMISQPALEKLKLAYSNFFSPATVQIALGRPPSVDPAVHNLIASIKIATGREVKFSSSDQLRWESIHRCKSRQELQLRYERRKTVQNLSTPPGLTVLLHEYGKLHRTCIHISGNLTQLFHSGYGGNKCQFLVAEAGNGLGNRVLWMVSTLMYAILTRRVILIDPRSMIPSLMCEPFPGSSWLAPSEFPFADLRPDLWRSTNEFIATLDVAKENHTEENVTWIHAARGDDSWGPTSRFYCTTEQSLFARVRWVTLGGCLYFLPKLFAIPAFKPVLESLFYDKAPLTHLLRFAMLPVDAIWAKVRGVEEMYNLTHTDRMIGVHVRYRGGYADFLSLHENVNSNVKRCVADNIILPKIGRNTSSGGVVDMRSPRRTVLFISSLYRSLYDDFSNNYSKTGHLPDTMMGEVFELVQLSSEGDQLSGLEIDRRALVEILCLSFSDEIFTSPMSTYSELAHAYGGLKPWIINNAITGSNITSPSHAPPPPCMRGTTLDGCYQGAAVFYVCPNDPDLDKMPIEKLVPSLKPCEHGSVGLHLV